MNALNEMTNLIDDVKEKLGDDTYLKLMDLSKKIHEHVLSERVFEHVSNNYRCLDQGVFCDCNANERVGYMLNDIIDIPKYLKLIAKLAADHYGTEFY